MMEQWKLEAACKQHPDLPWFAEHVDDRIVDVCRGCPVMDVCLMTALDGDDKAEAGIRAATTEQDRRDIRAGRREPWQVWEEQEQLHLRLAFAR